MHRTAKILNIILLILAIITVFGIFSGPISSADFWWHLKSGQYIWETRSLPSTDPFSYTTEWDPIDEPAERNKTFTLKQAWLGQIIMYGMYRLLSFEGIIYLRAVLLTVLIMLIYRAVRQEGVGLHASLLLTVPAVIIFSGFTPERPQLFSFLFFTLMVYVLERFRRTETRRDSLRLVETDKQETHGDSIETQTAETHRDLSRLIETNRDLKVSTNLHVSQRISVMYYLFPIPIIMLLWANTHGGFFLGIILLSVYFFAELAKHVTGRFGKPLPPKSLKLLGITALSASLASLINPNGYSVFLILAERRHGLYRYLISETISTIEHIKMGLFGPELIMFLLLFSICLLFFLTAVIVNTKKKYPTTLPSIPSPQGRGYSGDDLHQEGKESISDSPQQRNNSISSPPAGEGVSSHLLKFPIRRMDLTDALAVMIFSALAIYLFRLIPFFTPLAVVFISRYRPRLDNIPLGKKICTSLPLKDNTPLSTPPLRGGAKGEGAESIDTPPPYFSPLKGEETFKETASAQSVKYASTSQIALSSLLSLLLIFTLIRGSLFGGFVVTNIFHRDETIVGGKYPDKAVTFLKNADIPGHMFNPLDWGGYLMWYLFPDYKVFIDGRGLNERVVVDSAKILAAERGNAGDSPGWEAILDHYRVSFILTYSVEHFTGRLLPLIPALLNDPAWYLIYADDISLIFAKDMPGNGEILRKFSLPKEYAWREVITEAELKSKGFFGKNVRVNFLITMGDAFLSLRDYQSAMNTYAHAWQIAPGNPMARERLQFLQSIFR